MKTQSGHLPGQPQQIDINQLSGTRDERGVEHRPVAERDGIGPENVLPAGAELALAIHEGCGKQTP